MQFHLQHAADNVFASTVCLHVAFHRAMQESFSLEVSQSPSKLLANQVPSAKEPFCPVCVIVGTGDIQQC